MQPGTQQFVADDRQKLRYTPMSSVESFYLFEAATAINSNILVA